jgi:hypothetical protein
LDDDPGEEYTEEEVGERVERVVTGDKTAIEEELEVPEDVAEKVIDQVVDCFIIRLWELPLRLLTGAQIHQ